MSIRGPKRHCTESNQISRNDQPPPLITDQEKGYSCSCPPFECICGYQTVVPQQFIAHSPTNYPQQPYDAYWTPEQTQTAQPYQENTTPNSTTTQYDFSSFSADLFQPEEIFQLDQPLRPDYMVQQTDVARSPPTLLDLGSGTIHREFKNEEYWVQNQQISSVVNDDSNNSSCSRLYLNQSPENRDISLNNNIVTNGVDMDKLQFNLDSKMNDISQTCKYPSKPNSDTNFFSNCVQVEPDYRSQQSFSEIISDTRVYYGQDEPHLQNFTGSFNSEYKNATNFRYPVDIRVQEKNDLVDLDLPTYIDYSNITYETKVSLNDSMEIINDLDYRIHCNTLPLPNSQYTNEQFESINVLSNN